MSKALVTILSLFALSVGLVWYSARNNAPKEINNNTIVVGVNAEYPPFTFIRDNEIVGFDVDLINEIGKRLNKNIELKDMPFNALISEVQIGLLHVIIGGIAPTAERGKQVLFTKPYLQGRPLVIITKVDGPPVETVNDLTGKNVAVNEGFTSDLYMSTIEGPELLRLGTLSDSFLALQSGGVDALVAEQDTIQPLFETIDQKDFKIVVIPDTDDPSAIGITKKYPKLLPKIESILEELKNDGTLDQLRKKWWKL